MPYYFHDDQWAAIVFLRLPSCIPADFNLLDGADLEPAFPNGPPRVFGCALTVDGHAIFKNPGDSVPVQANLKGLGAVPVWFVKLSDIQAILARNKLTITQMLAIPSLRKGFANLYDEIDQPGVFRPQGEGNGSIHVTASGSLEDGTPFQRPENARFRPGTGFRELYFDETGDTNATSPENENQGGWCSVFKLTGRPGGSSARLSIFYRCDGTRAGFDNTSFLSHDLVTFVEDAGDTLHTQRNALDSGWVFDVTQDYSDPDNQPVRWLAEGRDPSATIDSAAGGFGKNDGDNEITGTEVSDGDTSVNGLLGEKSPHLFQNDKWRFFYTEQHGDNRTYEVVPAP